MKVIRDEDKKSNKYIMRFEVEKGKCNKYINDESNIMIKRTTEDYNNLVVYMADGSKPRYANIEKNKIKVLKLMRDQHFRNKKLLKRLIVKEKIAMAVAIPLLITGFGSIPLSILNDMSLFSVSAVVTFSSFALLTPLTAYGKSIAYKIEDIKKGDFVIENEEVLNEADLENKNILENVKYKDKAVINKIKQEKDKENDKHYFDINSIGIDGLSLDALRKIKDNIERENYLGLVMTDEGTKGNIESKGKSYVKK